MADPGHLRNAPIQEALVDLRIATSGSTAKLDERAAQAVMEPLIGHLQADYPKSAWQQRWETRVATSAGKVHGPETQMVGFQGLMLSDVADSRIVQFRFDGFTFSQLRGYSSGDDLFAESLRLWQPYVDALNPSAAIRVALRYINRLTLPLRTDDDFEKFLVAPVQMPAGTPQMVSEFLTRSVAHPDKHTSAVVTQRMEKGPPEAVPFVLDIDVFRTGEFTTSGTELLPLLQELRVIKNQLFFAFLTNAALEPYR
jgi:uncharacterized protein (TIGR04255 family)